MSVQMTKIMKTMNIIEES